MLLLGLLANIKLFGMVPAHQPLIFDVGTVLVYIPLLICAGFVYSDRTGQWVVLDNTHGKDGGVFTPLQWPLLLVNSRGQAI